MSETTTQADDGRTSGDVVTWNVVKCRVAFGQVRAALKAAGLAEANAVDMLPRNAFSRAARKLTKQRIIRKVAEDCDYLTFQYTAEAFDSAAGVYDYRLEATLSLDKASGVVTSKNAALALQAQQQIAEEIDHRGGGDITGIVQRLFKKKADLFPIRDAGGVYFVPALHAKFTEQVDRFFHALTGRHLGRYPVKAGTPHGDASVNRAVAEGLRAVIEEHAGAVAEFGADTRPHVLERAAQKIEQTRFKLEAYSAYLEGEREKLAATLDAARAQLRAKVEAIAAAEPAGVAA